MVQTERDERALHDAVERERSGGVSVHSPVRECLDPVADRRPDETQITAAAITAKAVMIGTERLPAKKPRYVGSCTL